MVSFQIKFSLIIFLIFTFCYTPTPKNKRKNKTKSKNNKNSIKKSIMYLTITLDLTYMIIFNTINSKKHMDKGTSKHVYTTQRLKNIQMTY